MCLRRQGHSTRQVTHHGLAWPLRRRMTQSNNTADSSYSAAGKACRGSARQIDRGDLDHSGIAQADAMLPTLVMAAADRLLNHTVPQAI